MSNELFYLRRTRIKLIPSIGHQFLSVFSFQFSTVLQALFAEQSRIYFWLSFECCGTSSAGRLGTHPSGHESLSRRELNVQGLNRDSNPGPLAPKARIIPLDHWATKILLPRVKHIVSMFDQNTVLFRLFQTSQLDDNRCKHKSVKYLSENEDVSPSVSSFQILL